MPYTYDYPRPAVTVDIVVLTVRDDALSVLLISRAMDPFRGEWALPGGFVNPNEGLEAAACRELKEETGLTDVYLEQLYTFGRPDRDPRGRVITVSHYALIPSERATAVAAGDAVHVGWFDIMALPTLAFDHEEIVDKALARLARRSENPAVALQLMPASFTLNELHRVYEMIGQSASDKPEFERRVLALEILEETGEQRWEAADGYARLYRVRG